jgi:alkanesulfonate monooxygenase SsuD/methylene tetrahydromethanopterin reductase-like flavin-dependent oxidoreductase (luciferase family)
VTATRWGLTVPFPGVPLADHLEFYRRAEALGYDDLWSGESPNGTDGFTTLALAIPVTERMRLATGIVNPFTRGPAVLAQTAAAMQEASGGRFVLGLGASSNVIVERFNGLEFSKPLSKVREAVERLTPVLSVPAQKGYGGLRLERPVTTPVPIVLAALRPKMLALAGEIAEGAFTNFLPLSGLAAVRDAHRAGDRRGAHAGRHRARLSLLRDSRRSHAGRRARARDVLRLRERPRVRGVLPLAGLGRAAGPDGRGLRGR